MHIHCMLICILQLEKFSEKVEFLSEDSVGEFY